MPSSAISPTSPSCRSTTPALGARKHVAFEPRLLAGDQRLDLAELAAGAVERLLAGRIPFGKHRQPPELFLGKRLPRFKFGEHGLGLAVVEPGEHVALVRPCEPSQLHCSTIRSRTSGVTFAQIRGSTTPLA